MGAKRLKSLVYIYSTIRGVEIDMALCAKREAHWTFKETKYYYSGFTNDLDDEVNF